MRRLRGRFLLSTSVDLERTGDTHEQANERAKQVIIELGEINRCTYQGLTVSATARQLGMSHKKVRYMRRVLKWDTWGVARGRGHYPETGASALARQCADI